MKDILGREVELGNIIAYAVRSGNSGELRIGIVLDPEKCMIRSVNGLRYEKFDKSLSRVSYLNDFSRATILTTTNIPEDVAKLLSL